MRRLSALVQLCAAGALLAACGGGDTEGADTAMGDTAAMAAPMAAPAGATLSLADVAGRWNARSVPESGDTTPTLFVLTATADTAGWTQTFPNREPVPMRVTAVGGDSIATEAGPFESVRRAGVQVRTHTVWRMMGDHLMGTTVARYETTGADSVLRFRTEATRAP